MSRAYNTLVKDTDGKYYYDYEKAFELFNLNNLSGISQYYIGECYYYGRGVPEDTEQASEYFYTSMSQGFSKAFTQIGYMTQNQEYYTGGRTHSDYMNLALACYKRGVEEDDTDVDAKVKLAEFCLFEVSHVYEPDSEEHVENQENAIELLQQAAAQKSAEAYFILGQLAGVENMTEFSTPSVQIQLYIHAAELGSMPVLKHIANFYFKYKKNLEELVWWYWWAKHYDPLYTNDKIVEYIKNDELSSMVYQKMTEQNTCYHMVVDENDRRLYDDVHAMWFNDALKTYYKDKLRSRYVSFSEKIRISQLFAKKKPKPKRIVYDYETYIPVYVAATILSTKVFSQKLLTEVILPLNQIELHKKNKKLRRIPASVYEDILNECDIKNL